MKKPNIFLSGDIAKCPNYLSALLSAGFSVSFDDPNSADALCLCGGGDVSPCLYGQLNVCSKDIDLKRDGLELFLLRKFLKNDRPVIAICRGMQIANVYFGGSLLQNVSDHSQYMGKDVFHDVTTFGTLREIYGEVASVNSAHHQAVDKLGEGLKITAISRDGVIEGFEGKNVFACQFHPERLFGKTDGKMIFKRFYRKYFG